jgi:hypothetical protein
MFFDVAVPLAVGGERQGFGGDYKMAEYLMLADAFIDGVRRRKGETVSFGGVPSKMMKALDVRAQVLVSPRLGDKPKSVARPVTKAEG